MLEVYKDWIDEHTHGEMFYEIMYKNRWKFGQVSDSEIEPNYPQWFQNFYVFKYRDYGTECPEVAINLGDRFMEQFCPEGYTMVRNMASANTFGLDGDIHTDWSHPDVSITGVLYTDKEWEDNWGGETIFYYPDTEIAHAITYEPRKLIVFDSSIPHIGKGPQRRCKEMRSVMAFQAVKTEALEERLAKSSK